MNTTTAVLVATGTADTSILIGVKRKEKNKKRRSGAQTLPCLDCRSPVRPSRPARPPCRASWRWAEQRPRSPGAGRPPSPPALRQRIQRLALDRPIPFLAIRSASLVA